MRHMEDHNDCMEELLHQVKSGPVFAGLLSNTEVSSLLESPKLSCICWHKDAISLLGEDCEVEETRKYPGIIHSRYGAI